MDRPTRLESVIAFALPFPPVTPAAVDILSLDNRRPLFLTRCPSDRPDMHDVQKATDVPYLVVVERRHTPDRRSGWRGGRRNTDWFTRPIGGWRQLEQQLVGWRHWLAKLPLTNRGMHAFVGQGSVPWRP